MKGFALAKYCVSCGNGDQTVSPVGPNVAVLYGSISTPRCSRYQAASFTGSCALKKTPPIPITRSMPGDYTKRIDWHVSEPSALRTSETGTGCKVKPAAASASCVRG